MFEKIRPEQAGISPKLITKLLKVLDKNGARTHSFIMLKGGKVFAEGYYKPFNADFCHRQYSQTKSFVGIAVGLLIDEGKISLDDKLYKYFGDRIYGNLHSWFLEQTIEETLTMTTCQPENGWWFTEGEPDRVKLYYSCQNPLRPSGTLWQYDSPGSQVLCSLVEKLSGKPMLEYMKEKLFNKMDCFSTAKMLKIPCGDSWGDSAMICTQRDMACFAQLLINGGKWNGEQLISQDYVKRATSAVVDNNEDAFFHHYRQGYGYQIWKTDYDGFSFVGMGDQLTVGIPSKDFIFSICSDNQGNKPIRELIYAIIFDGIIDSMSDGEIPFDDEGYNELTDYISKLELFSVKGSLKENMSQEVNGVTYKLCDNKMGIKNSTLVFNDDDTGEWIYENDQGKKSLKFGINKNVFSQFPQLGYSKEYGSLRTFDGHTYKCAVSGKWLQKNKFVLAVQIIDDYLGNFSATFAFKGDEVSLSLSKTAEDFLDEYDGTAVGKKI